MTALHISPLTRSPFASLVVFFHATDVNKDLGNGRCLSMSMTSSGTSEKKLALFARDIRITGIRSDVVRRSRDRHV